LIYSVKVKRGDNRPAVRVRVLDSAGHPVILDGLGGGASELRFEMTGPATVAGVPRVVGRDQLEYVFRDGDTDTVGLYLGVFKARFRDGWKMIPSVGAIPVEVVARAAA
jgi:hypothetical protein